MDFSKWDNIRYAVSKGPVSESLWYFKATVQGGGSWEAWNLQPDYQRDSVWDRARQESFVGSWLCGALIPPIFVQRSTETGESEVIDGQQRCRAFLAFLDGEIAARLPDGEEVRFSDITKKDRIPAIQVVYVDIPRADRIRLYLSMNSGGVPHTAAELDRARQLLNT